jgi:hypothetical protein
MQMQAIHYVHFYVFIRFYVQMTLNNKAVWASFFSLNKINSDVPVVFFHISPQGYRKDHNASLKTQTA